MNREQVIFITGASSGFGQSCADYLSDIGYRVYGTSRTATFPSQPTYRHWTNIPLDVRDQQSVDRAIRFVLDREGRIDVLINNAGYGIAGAVEDTSITEYQQQFDTNFFGAVRMCKAVLPHMRENQSGLIINISSIGGFIGLPFQSAYSAAKFALEGFTECLRFEVKPLGIRVLLLEPGDFLTGFIHNRRYTQQHTDASPYFQRSTHAVDVIIRGEQKGRAPFELAKKVSSLIQVKSPRVRYTIGPWTQRLAAKLKYFFPAKLFERFVEKEFNHDAL